MPVTFEPEPHVACRVFEVSVASSDFCTCDLPGYAPVTDVKGFVRQRLRQKAICGADRCCSELCFCELLQYTGQALQDCLTDPTVPYQPAGWCYVDPSKGAGSYEALDDGHCGEHQIRLHTVDSHFFGLIACEL